MIFFLGLVFLVVLLVTVPKLVKKNMWKELMVFVLFLILAALYSIGPLYEWPLPNPTRHLEYQFVSVSNVMEKLFP